MLSMNPAALALLLDANCLRMAAAWPGFAASIPEDLDYNANAWATAAGIPGRLATQVAHKLMIAGICREDGTLAKEAEDYLVRRAFAPIAGQIRPRKEPR